MFFFCFCLFVVVVVVEPRYFELGYFSLNPISLEALFFFSKILIGHLEPSLSRIVVDVVVVVVVYIKGSKYHSSTLHLISAN